MPDGNRNDPYGQFNFIVEIDGVVQGGFSEVQRAHHRDRHHRVPRGQREHGTDAQAARADEVHQHRAQARLHQGHRRSGTGARR